MTDRYKNLSYFMWHIFRIEDIVAHTLICGNVMANDT